MVRRADFNFERRDPQEANFRFEKEQPIKAIFKIAPPTVNYELLINKPKINHIELIGDKSLEDLGITAEIIDLIAQHNTSEEAHEFIRNLIAQEVIDREAADLLLDEKILQEILDRKTADQTLQNNINEEARVRAEQDLAIREALADEARIRIEQDQVLQTNIENEATTRQNADQELSQRITQEAQTRQQADTALGQRISEETTSRQQADKTLQTNINTEATARQQADTALGNRIDSIDELIPAEASSSNKLTDTAYVIDLIKMNAASYRGSWATWAAVPTDPNLYPADAQGDRTPTANDYMIVIADETKDGGTWMYKYTGTWSTKGKSGWQAEYEIEKTPFTPEQQAAIDSGITSALVGQITTNENDISDINSTLSGYGDIVTHNVAEFATAAQGALADTAVQPEELGNGTITIVQGEDTKGTFTVNQSGNTTITLDRGGGIPNLDGGSANTIYTIDQIVDCGGAQD